MGNGIFRVLVTSKTLILPSMWMLHPLDEYNNPGFFDLSLSINRNSAFIFLHVSVEIVGNAIFKIRKNAQEMYHGMPSPALGWSSGKKTQVKARHEIRFFTLLSIPHLCYIQILICAFLAMRKISPFPKCIKQTGHFNIRRI